MKLQVDHPTVAFMNVAMNLWVHSKAYLDQLSNYQLFILSFYSM